MHIVHEITHIFDLNIEGTNPNQEEIAENKQVRRRFFTRDIIRESTAIAFEGMFTEYLLKNTSYSKAVIKEIASQRSNSSLNDARIVYAKLLLAREKEEKGRITIEYIETAMRENHLSVQMVRNMAVQLIEDSRDIFFEKKYAIAGLLSPTIVKRYKEKGIEPIKKYLEEAKNENLKGALEALDIDLSEKSLNELIRNMSDMKKN